MPEIRTTVLGLVRRERDGAYLVQRLTDPADGPFYRPIGGGIEFGESSEEALEREFREELGVDVSVGPTVGTIENRFTWAGNPDHELVVLREATFDDEALYDRERFDGVDAGGAVEYEATWKRLDHLVAAADPLYPEGLAELVAGDAGDGRGHLADP